jgi:uncharacterized protein
MALLSDDALGAATALIARCHEELIAPLVPASQQLWDVHAHLGSDADGSVLEAGALLAEMQRFRVARTFVFPFRMEDIAAYRRRNEAIIEICRTTGGRLVPLCRVEPGPGAVAELERALDSGARGVKLHPLTGRFEVGDPLVAAALELAERRSVPVLLHAGRGIAAFADELSALLHRYPGAQVVLAHAAIGDLEAWAQCAHLHPSLAFDVAVWNLLDMHALLARVAPEQIVYGTDAPYYGAACVQAKLLLGLRAAGASPEQLASILWGNADRLAAGRSAATLSPPIGPPLSALDFRRLRAHEYLLACFPLVWTNQPDLLDALRLARHAVGRPDTRPLEAACEMIELAAGCWQQELRGGSRREILSLSWTTFRLLEFADALIYFA